MNETYFSPIQPQGTDPRLSRPERRETKRSEGARSQAKEVARKAREVASALPDVRLHFRIDPQTNDVTVVIVDKVTERVVRTIPPDKLRELAQGGLVELLT